MDVEKWATWRQFRCPKLSMQAPHYSWSDQGVVTWKISAEHQMRWLLSMHTKIRKLHKLKGRPCNVKTIEWGPEFLPTFLAEYEWNEKFHCDSKVKLSVL